MLPLLLPLLGPTVVVGGAGGHPMGRAERRVQAESAGAGKPAAPHLGRWLRLAAGGEILCSVKAALLLPGCVER